MLLFHIGLPKTATTFVQYRIFQPAVGHRFLHRRAPGDGETVCKLVKALIRAEGEEDASLLHDIAQLLKPYANGTTTIITDEGISLGPVDFWTGEAPTPARVAKGLSSIRAALAGLFPEIRVVIGVRRQDSWLPSRYAQSSKSMKEFGQEDFDRRALEIAAGPLRGPIEWLNYSVVRSLFAAEFGEDNLLIYSMEKLREDPDGVLGELGRFAGNLDFVGYRDQAVASGEPLFENILSVGEDAWKLAGKRGTLTLKPHIRSALIARFAASNEAAGRHIDLRFG
ncbi:MAG: hypothetical protein ABIY37_13800 [Devosia sp.]